MENIVVDKVNFKFASRFSSLIGRNLISNPIVAVSELVKNSYDADANNINVTFLNLLSGISQLVIEDDGDGMSLDDIKSKWMVVGTANKVESPYTKLGRRKLGEKGIGRFSVERLSKKLNITTTRDGEDFALVFDIDWDEEENSSAEFGEHSYPIYQIPCEKEKKGTKIQMSYLRDEWNENNLVDLRKELNLIRPIDINSVSYEKYEFKGDKIKIKLNAPDYLKKGQKIDSKLMSYHQAHLYGRINEDGTAAVKVSINSNVSTSGKFLEDTYSFGCNDIDMSCGPVVYEAFVFLKDKRLYKSLDIDKKYMDDYLNTYSGVKIYRDGFRILPFGDIDNDWLELNAKRTSSPEHRIGTQNTIGIVYISRDKNPGLQDVLSRENMYETKEFSALKEFVNIAFEKYTSLQLAARKEKEKKVKEEGKSALDNVKKSVTIFSKHIDELKSSIEKVHHVEYDEQIVDVVDQFQKKMSTVLQSAETSLQKMQTAYTYYKFQDDFKTREMQIYRNIATLGISAAMFGHEALNQTLEAKAICKDIKADYKELIMQIQNLQESFDDLEKDLCLINEKADFFRSYLKREKQDRVRYVNLKSVVEDLLKQHKVAFDAIGVDVQFDFCVDEELKFTWGYEGDYEAIFTNLITNAYKALKKERGHKYFKVMIGLEGDSYIITAENNGKVIEKSNRNKIFQPLFSTYSDGTGLGLTIVQDTVANYLGSIELEDIFPQTKFKIIIPRQLEPKEEEV